jgi:murein L,D-transpeptidase YcbB/YkuD
LTQSVRRFQKRHGLQTDGTVGNRTPAALAEPVGDQLARAAEFCPQ